MNFPFFHNPRREELASLRDRLIEAETRACLLENVLEDLRRPRREVRSDAESYQQAKQDTTARLRAATGWGQ